MGYPLRAAISFVILFPFQNSQNKLRRLQDFFKDMAKARGRLFTIFDIKKSNILDFISLLSNRNFPIKFTFETHV